ncbi:hypothetical protein KC349_g138 [Hortaea werneckii]|nr:hypothetical protein KC349_g138 [Hortaea werneckii]
MIQKVDIPGPRAVRPHKLSIPRRPLRLRVARQHTLDADTDALDVMHGAPPLRVEQVKADDARREGHFGRFDRVGGGEEEAEPVLGGYERDARGRPCLTTRDAVMQYAMVRDRGVSVIRRCPYASVVFLMSLLDVPPKLRFAPSKAKVAVLGRR